MPTNELRLTSPGGTKYAVMGGYPRIHIDKDKGTGTDKWRILATDMSKLALEIAPPAVIIGTLVYQPPGMIMNGTVMRSMSVDFGPHGNERPMDPFGNDAAAPAETYEKYATATIKFAIDRFSGQASDPSDPKTFLTHSFTAGAKILSIPPNNLKLNNQPNRNAVSVVSKVVPTIEHTLKWPQALNPDWDQITDMLGKVNSKDISFSNAFESPPESTLFTGVSGSKKYLWNGFTTVSDPWDLTFKFSSRHFTDKNVVNGPAGWNHAYNSKTGKWEKVTLPDGSFMYDEDDLIQMFV